jgi:hypothetical protein
MLRVKKDLILLAHIENNIMIPQQKNDHKKDVLLKLDHKLQIATWASVFAAEAEKCQKKSDQNIRINFFRKTLHCKTTIFAVLCTFVLIGECFLCRDLRLVSNFCSKK